MLNEHTSDGLYVCVGGVVCESGVGVVVCVIRVCVCGCTFNHKYSFMRLSIFANTQTIYCNT